MTINKQLVNEIQKSFIYLLKEYLPKELFTLAKENKKIKILSIGCGRFREAKSIFNYFDEYKKNINLYGIDNDKDLLEDAKKDEMIIKNSVSIKLADASLIESYKEWTQDGLFDLVIVRHPEITFNTDVFIKIFSLIPGLLTKKGILFVTTHFENEKESLKLLLKLLKLNIMIDIENQLSPSLKKDKELLFADKFLIISTM